LSFLNEFVDLPDLPLFDNKTVTAATAAPTVADLPSLPAPDSRQPGASTPPRPPSEAPPEVPIAFLPVLELVANPDPEPAAKPVPMATKPKASDEPGKWVFYP
jgi:hypothetical protein